MLLPARTAVLNYLYKVGKADINQIMEALKPDYGNERQFTRERYLDHVMSLEANGLLVKSGYGLDGDGELSIEFEINEDGRATVEKYIPAVFR
ncbi:MAG: hypothetical protein Q4F28_13255 [Eubacteriales bacterium]|nr:hypothetical protein [Eubacteriales bacterium]